MYDDGMPVTPLEDWRTFWEFPEEQTDGPTRQEFEADEAITAAEWPQLGEAWMLAFRYTAWDIHRRFWSSRAHVQTDICDHAPQITAGMTTDFGHGA